MLQRINGKLLSYMATILFPFVVASSHAALEGVLLAPQNGQSAQHLLVLLHGYGSNEQDLLPLADYVNGDYAVLSLQAPIAVGGNRYAWYRTASPSLSEVRFSTQQVITRIAQLQQQLKITPANTLLAGFSQGAVISWTIALTSPATTGAVAIFSGRLPSDIPAPETAGRLPQLFVGHGQRDPRIPLALEEQAVAVAQQRGYSLSVHRYSRLGHNISEQELDDFKQWANRLTLQKL